MTNTSYSGKHPNTAALKNVLAAQGVKAPHINKPFSEAMLLGEHCSVGSPEEFSTNRCCG